MGQWLDVWFESYCKLKVRPSSHQTYAGHIKHHIKPYIGKTPLNKLTTLQLQKMYGKLLSSGRIDRVEAKGQSNGLSPKTVRNIHNIISSALEKAKLDAFFAEAKNSGVFEQYYTEMATGLRRGELLGLKWTDIDFRNLTIFVRRQLLRLDGVVQEAPLKTNNSYRSISIDQELADILKAKRERERGLSEYVFSSPTGDPISPDSVLHMLHRVLERAGLEKIRYHDLRHPYVKLKTKKHLSLFPKNEPHAEKDSCMRLISDYMTDSNMSFTL